MEERRVILEAIKRVLHAIRINEDPERLEQMADTVTEIMSVDNFQVEKEEIEKEYAKEYLTLMSLMKVTEDFFFQNPSDFDSIIG